MHLGIFTPVWGTLTLEEMLKEVARYPRVKSLEIGTGGWPGASHIDVDRLLNSDAACGEYKLRLADAGLNISALSCHGNPLHPDAAVAQAGDEVFRKTVRLAEKLGVSVVVTFSGCPGGSEKDATPNWIVAPWPPEFASALRWQWEQRLIPYWRQAGALAAEHGVKVAIEAHPGFCVYSPETMLRLRAATSPAVGINLDPSHLWWQGVDIPVAIEALGDAIHHVHAKDVALYPAKIHFAGVLDARSYAELQKRSWSFRTVGWGHGEMEWRSIVSALRLARYDGVLSIEHEDALASRDQGLRYAVDFLDRVLLDEPPVEAWWV